MTMDKYGIAVGATLLALLLSNGARASTAEAPLGNLEDQLNLLNLPGNQAPASIANEKLYAVQTRYAPLTHRSEIVLGGGLNVTGSGFLDTKEASLGYRFHFGDRWSLGLSGSLVNNSLTNTAQLLISREGIIPDVAYAKYRADATLGFNVFYGKFRLSMDQVFYFDQYASIGAGVAGMNTGSAPAAVADLGFAFWMGRSGVVRFGVKDYFHQEKRNLGQNMVHNVHGHLDVGILLGGDGT